MTGCPMRIALAFAEVGTVVARAVMFPILVWLTLSVAAGAQEVTKVINGETIEVDGVGKVRLLGIDAAEPAVRFGPSGPARPPRSGPDRPPPPLITGSIGVKAESASGDALKQLVLGKRVRLEYDEAADKDRGTRRAYVFLEDDTLVNAEMLRAGHARVDTSRPFSSLNQFKELEAEARADLRGLWADVEKR
jgi:micrococcal nuclease